MLHVKRLTDEAEQIAARRPSLPFSSEDSPLALPAGRAAVLEAAKAGILRTLRERRLSQQEAGEALHHPDGSLNWEACKQNYLREVPHFHSRLEQLSGSGQRDTYLKDMSYLGSLFGREAAPPLHIISQSPAEEEELKREEERAHRDQGLPCVWPKAERRYLLGRIFCEDAEGEGSAPPRPAAGSCGTLMAAAVGPSTAQHAHPMQRQQHQKRDAENEGGAVDSVGEQQPKKRRLGCGQEQGTTDRGAPAICTFGSSVPPVSNPGPCLDPSSDSAPSSAGLRPSQGGSHTNASARLATLLAHLAKLIAADREGAAGQHGVPAGRAGGSAAATFGAASSEEGGEGVDPGDQRGGTGLHPPEMEAPAATTAACGRSVQGLHHLSASDGNTVEGLEGLSVVGSNAERARLAGLQAELDARLGAVQVSVQRLT